MSFDDTLKIIGEFGPYQRFIYFLICLPVIFNGLSDVSNAFLLYSPTYSCANYTTSWLPSNETSKQNGTEGKNSMGICYENKTPNSSAYKRCSSWKYDKSVFSETFVSEHDLVCEDSATPIYMKTTMYFGAFLGAMSQGSLADRFGRKRVSCINLTVALISGFLSSFSPNIYVFTFLRFLQTLAFTGVNITAFVLAIEMVGRSVRRWAGITFIYFYSGGVVLLTGIGYWLRHWKYIQIASSAPLALSLVTWYLIIPESPRWLISRGKKTKARAIIMRIAKSNKTESKVPADDDWMEVKETTQTKNDLKQFCSICSLVCRSLIVFFSRFVACLCYYGFAFNIENLSGMFYVNFLINALLDFPGMTICLVFGDKLGRKKLYFTGMLVGGTFLLGSALTVFLQWKATIDQVQIGKVLPLIILGLLCLLGSPFALLLPETGNKVLPETVANARDMN